MQRCWSAAAVNVPTTISQMLKQVVNTRQTCYQTVKLQPQSRVFFTVQVLDSFSKNLHKKTLEIAGMAFSQAQCPTYS